MTEESSTFFTAIFVGQFKLLHCTDSTIVFHTVEQLCARTDCLKKNASKRIFKTIYSPNTISTTTKTKLQLLDTVHDIQIDDLWPRLWSSTTRKKHGPLSLLAKVFRAIASKTNDRKRIR